MKSTLNKLNKPIVLAFGIMAFIVLIWSLFYFDGFVNLSTDYRNGVLDTTIRTNIRVLQAFYGDQYVSAWENVDKFYRAAQSFNQTLFTFTVVVIALWAVSLVFGNLSRKKYFVSNLVSGCVISLTAIIYSIVVLVKNVQIGSMYKEYYENLAVYDTITSVGWSNASKYAQNGELQNYFSLSDTATTATTIFVIMFMLVALVNLVFTVLKYVNTNRKVEE